MPVERVGDRHAQDLEVDALLVAHLEHADRASPDVAAREGPLIDEQHGVGRVAVVGERALDEAVVEVVEHGRREDAVEAEDPGDLVVLVLVAAAAGISTTTSMTAGNSVLSFMRASLRRWASPRA